MNIFRAIETVIDWVGEHVSLLNFVLVILICIDVALRYMFSFSKNWILELEWHFFAIIFLLGAAYTLKYDKHVRVDVFYQKMSQRQQAIVNLVGTLIFLFPWCYIVITTSTGFALNSWYMGEGSPNPGGLPARYIIKSIVPLAFILLLLEGIVLVKQQVKTIMSK